MTRPARVAWLTEWVRDPTPPWHRARRMCLHCPPGLLLMCTRRPGHTGRHHASDGTRIVAVWPVAHPSTPWETR